MLRETKVEHLHYPPIRLDFDVARLEVPVHDALLMRCVERSSDLAGHDERLIDRNRALFDLFVQGLAVDEFHYQVIRTHIMQRTDVGMVQGCHRARFAFETVTEAVGAYLYRHFTPQPGVAGSIDLAHTTRPNEAKDLVRAESRTRFQNHLGENCISSPLDRGCPLNAL